MASRRSSLAPLRRTLRRTFGLEQLRPGQADVIRSVLAGRDTVAIMPTGAGKSLCYQLPALHLDGTTVVVSPLISLMKDQVDKLQEAGVSAVQLNSALTASERAAADGSIGRRRTDFIFVTPERMAAPGFPESLAGQTVDFVVIDEAHCISEWGHDFRPAYLELGDGVRRLGRPPVLALTATATPAVVQDIVARLRLRKPAVFNGGIDRPNLLLEVLRVGGHAAKRDALLAVMEGSGGTGIVYCATVRHVEDVTAALSAAGRNVAAYHGRRPTRERRATQDRFMSGALEAIVATNAFGMGIDKPDIRWVAHYDMPGSLEAYYQEAGRAGRDGEAARAALLYDPADRRTQAFFLGGRYPRPGDIDAVYRALHSAAANDPVPLSAVQAAAAGVAAAKVRVALAMLKEAGLARQTRGARYAPAGAEISSGALADLAREWEARALADREKLERMVDYGQTTRCRWALLQEYFDAPDERPDGGCGHCDNCLDPVADRIRAHGLHRASDEHLIVEASPTPPPFTAGEAVAVPRYGAGEVVGVADEVVTVRLADGSTRRFKAEFVARDEARQSGAA